MRTQFAEVDNADSLHLPPGGNIRDRGTCGAFQSLQLTYRHVLRSGDEDGDGGWRSRTGDGDAGWKSCSGDEDEDGDGDGDPMHSRHLMYSGDLI